MPVVRNQEYSQRFLDPLTQRALKNWIKLEQPKPIPWTPLRKTLAECTIALISSGGMAMLNDTPYDQELERQDPWRSDPSFRLIPRTASSEDIRTYHLHINTDYCQADINCLLPVERLNELETAGVIGRAADQHYTFMGYVLDPTRLLQESVPAMIAHIQADSVDAVLLAPA